MHIDEGGLGRLFCCSHFSYWRFSMTTLYLSTGWQQLNDIPLITLHFGGQRCEVSLYGAHVLSYFDGNAERLWCSSSAVWQNRTAIRGGIPICWPWFGACDPSLNPEQQKRTNHGLVRNRFWQLEHWHQDATRTSVELSIVVADVPWLNHPARLTYLVQLDENGLQVALSSDDSFVQQAALHSYFHTADLTATAVRNLPEQFHDKVHQCIGSESSGVCKFATEIDRIYLNAPTELKLHLPETFTLRQAGHDASIVWNPGQAKGCAASDIGNQWADFICVESAHLSLEPKKLALSQQIIRS